MPRTDTYANAIVPASGTITVSTPLANPTFISTTGTAPTSYVNLAHFDRLPPDLDYFLTCSVSCGHMTADVAHFFTDVCHESARVIDAATNEEPRNREFEAHWNGLQNSALRLEAYYLKWRAQNLKSRDAAVCSWEGLQSLYVGIHELVDEYANKFVEAGYTTLNGRALAWAKRKTLFATAVGLTKRAVVRAKHDLAGWTEADLLAIDQEIAARRAAEQSRLRALYANQALFRTTNATTTLGQYNINNTLSLTGLTNIITGATVLNTGDVYNVWVGDECTPDECTPDEWEANRPRPGDKAWKAMQAAARAKARQSRKVLKRSVKFLSRLAGIDTTRVFISGQKLRVEGLYGNYEISKTGRLGQGHGGASLAIRAKEDDVELARICIYTPGVPTLDHVAALILHIQAGEEDEILKTGNLFRINQARAYEEEWLRPYLPKKRETGPHVINLREMEDAIHIVENPVITSPALTAWERRRAAIPDFQQKAMAMRGEVRAYLRDVYAPHMPEAALRVLRAENEGYRTLFPV